ncbi:hypothetical protein RND81_03G192300 [Saponaria officinalis]|uniref:Uncharacterized protein n=1 Tax=Saponaria officinalis TaxID=3572 RepID=A0AAW1M1C5_SAPOF
MTKIEGKTPRATSFYTMYSNICNKSTATKIEHISSLFYSLSFCAPPLTLHNLITDIFMAQRSPSEDTVNDMTRESLIAISNTLPENEPTASSKKTPRVVNKDSASMDNYRSELISLSYTVPVDEPLPQLKG